MQEANLRERAIGGCERPPPWREATGRLLLLGVLVCLCPGPLLAQRGAAVVRLDGRPLLRVTADTAPELRAREVEHRIEALVAAPEPPAPARVQRGPGDTVYVVMGAVKVVRISAADAEENLLKPDSLGHLWALTLDSAIAEARAARGGAIQSVTVRVRGAVRASFSRMAEGFISHLPGIVAAVAILFGTWAAGALLRLGWRLLPTRLRIRDASVENLARHLTFYAVWIIGIVLALDSLGVPVQTLVTGLGLTSLALGFALRDMISNFFSGVMLLALRPFTLGDDIEVGDTRGRVVRIELRATEIQTADGRMVIVPNADLFTSVVTNNTSSPMRQGEVRCPIDYGDDLRRVMSLLRSSAESVSGVARNPPVAVVLQDLGGSEIWVRVTFWCDCRKVELVATRDAVGLAMLEGLASGGFTLPSPHHYLSFAREGNLPVGVR